MIFGNKQIGKNIEYTVIPMSYDNYINTVHTLQKILLK